MLHTLVPTFVAVGNVLPLGSTSTTLVIVNPVVPAHNDAVVLPLRLTVSGLTLNLFES